MANFGLSKPWMASLDLKTNTYKNAFKCGELVSTNVTPAYNEASLRGDNKEVRNVKKFKNAAVTLGVTHLPLAARQVVFGHEVDQNSEMETSRTSDKGSYIGYGFISEETLDDRDVFVACILKKVIFAEGEDAYTTEGDSITFSNPTLTGTALGMENDEWRIRKVCSTELEADEWIQTQFGAKEKCKLPTASMESGEYEGAQTVTLTCGTEGAAIRYTTNGTIPTETNGEEYTGAITVETTTGLRAVAYKTDAVKSEIMEKEYFIS